MKNVGYGEAEIHIEAEEERSIHPDIFFGIMDVWQWMPVTTQRKKM